MHALASALFFEMLHDFRVNFVVTHTYIPMEEAALHCLTKKVCNVLYIEENTKHPLSSIVQLVQKRDKHCSATWFLF